MGKAQAYIKNRLNKILIIIKFFEPINETIGYSACAWGILLLLGFKPFHWITIVGAIAVYFVWEEFWNHIKKTVKGMFEKR